MKLGKRLVIILILTLFLLWIAQVIMQSMVSGEPFSLTPEYFLNLGRTLLDDVKQTTFGLWDKGRSLYFYLYDQGQRLINYIVDTVQGFMAPVP